EKYIEARELIGCETPMLGFHNTSNGTASPRSKKLRASALPATMIVSRRYGQKWVLMYSVVLSTISTRRPAWTLSPPSSILSDAYRPRSHGARTPAAARTGWI